MVMMIMMIMMRMKDFDDNDKAHKSGIDLASAMSQFQSGDQIKMIMPMTWQMSNKN